MRNQGDCMRKSFYNSEQYWKNYYPSDDDYYLCKAWREDTLSEQERQEYGILTLQEESALEEEFETEYRLADVSSKEELQESIYQLHKIHHKLIKNIKSKNRIEQIDHLARSHEKYDKAIRTGRSLAYFLSYGLGIGLLSFACFFSSKDYTFSNAILIFLTINLGILFPGLLIGAFVQYIILPYNEALRNYTPLTQILFSVLLSVVVFIAAYAVFIH